jgi:hypothetical protein
MATPTITATQTVLAWAVGQEFSFQLTATGEPTAWRVAAGTFLPNGLLFDTASGRIYGSGTIAGVWDVRFIASNADGDSAPLLFTMGLFDVPQGRDISKAVVINTSTWAVTFPDAFAAETPLAAAAGGVRYGDIVTFSLRFVEGATGQSVTNVFPKLLAAKFSIKGLDTDPVFFVTEDWNYKTSVVYDGSGYVRRYFVNVTFTDAALLAFLGDYEAESGTRANCLCEFQLIFSRYPGAGPGEINRITTQPFLLRVQRDNIP